MQSTNTKLNSLLSSFTPEVKNMGSSESKRQERDEIIIEDDEEGGFIMSLMDVVAYVTHFQPPHAANFVF